MRGYFSINSTIKDRYIDIMFNAYWRDNLDIADEKILISLVESCKINPDQFLTAIKDPIIKDKLKICSLLYFSVNRCSKSHKTTISFIVLCFFSTF